MWLGLSVNWEEAERVLDKSLPCPRFFFLPNQVGFPRGSHKANVKNACSAHEASRPCSAPPAEASVMGCGWDGPRRETRSPSFQESSGFMETHSRILNNRRARE